MSSVADYEMIGGDFGGMTSSANQPAWWETTLQHVITAAADAKFKLPQYGGNQQYLMTADGRLVPAGYATGTVLNPPAASAMPSWAPLAFAVLAGVIMLKLVR